MGTAELVIQATAELYGCDPAEFTQRRTEIAARARAAGDRDAARQIAGLRKPTRSAWVANQLARADPGASARLAAFAAEFMARQAAADGTALRRLSQERRQLIDALVRQALAAAGERAPSAALRDEVAATLGAALADPRVAADLAAGTLTRAAQSADFGFSVAAQASGSARPRPAGGKVDDAQTAPRQGTAAAPAKEVAAARAERERQQAVARAEQAIADALLALDAAAAATRERQDAVREIEQQLAGARAGLQRAQLRARQAAAAHRNAVHALRRLPR